LIRNPDAHREAGVASKDAVPGFNEMQKEDAQCLTSRNSFVGVHATQILLIYQEHTNAFDTAQARRSLHF
jgi:hypothetical protein